MDLVRKILLAVEAGDRQLESPMLRIAGYPRESITEHLRMLNEVGLVEGIQTYSIEHKLKWSELRLTWNGHEFLDAARNEAIWTEIVSEVRTKIGSVPFELLKSLLLESTHDKVRPSVQYVYPNAVSHSRRSELAP